MKNTWKKVISLVLAMAVVLTAAVFVQPMEVQAKAKKLTIEKVGKKLYAVQVDMTLGSTPGTGSHAKVLFQTAKSAVSFGIQYDTACGNAAYRGKAAFMFENIRSNKAGGQSYVWVKKAKRDTTYKVLLTLNAWTGDVTAYVNGKKVGAVNNSKLKTRKPVTVAVEGAARLDGDSLDADFDNIKIKAPDEKFKEGCSSWGGKTPRIVDRNNGLSVNASGYHIEANPDGKHIAISGTMSGLGGKDWDSAYEHASDVVQFIW